jgi:peptidoglycan/LPS O-acetylase OafA/YrhL
VTIPAQAQSEATLDAPSEVDVEAKPEATPTAKPEAAPREKKAPGAGRMPSLDGLRAVSILLVLWSHVNGRVGFPPMPKFVTSLGDFGVRVFFVISGYLITTLLIGEQAKTGTISLKGFYVRRVYRIFPAFYVFIAVVAALSAAGVLTLRPGDLLHAVTFTMNYHEARSWWVGHLWSLSVEEQFYLIWPALLLLAGVRRGLRVAAAVMVLSPVARVAAWHLWPDSHEGMGELFPTICDSIAVGCLLSGGRKWLDGQPGYLRALRSPAAMLLPFLALLVHQLWRHPSIYLPVGHTVVNVTLALYIDRVVRFPEGADGWLLNRRPLEYVGQLSYSLYLWQQLFFNRHSRGVLCSFPLNVGLAALAAVVSYYTVEKTFLDLRARRARVGRAAH